MEFNCNQTALYKELGFVFPVTEKKSPSTPVLRNVLLRAEAPDRLRIVGSTSNTTLITEVEADVVTAGDALVLSEQLFRLTKQLPGGPVNFKKESNDRVRLTQESINFRIAGDPVDSFPALPAPQQPAVEIPAHVLKTLIEFTSYSITTDEGRFNLAGAKFVVDSHATMMVATNGHALAVIKHPGVTSKKKISALIPVKALGELVKLTSAHEGTVGFSCDDGHAYFTVGSRTLIATLSTGQFPNWTKIIPADNNLVATFNSSELLESLGRVSLVADSNHHRVELSLSGNQMTISASADAAGDGVERRAVEYDGSDLSIGFNASYLSDFLRAAAGAKVTAKFKDENTQGVFTPDLGEAYNMMYIIAPVRK